MSAAKTHPAYSGALYTPHDTNEINPPTRGVLLAEDGPLAVVLENDLSSFVIPKLAAGIIHPLCCKKILDTGTTATSVAIFR